MSLTQPTAPSGSREPRPTHRAAGHVLALGLAVLGLAALARPPAGRGATAQADPCLPPTAAASATAVASATATAGAGATARATAHATGAVATGTSAAETATAIARGTWPASTPVAATARSTSAATAAASATAAATATSTAGARCTATPTRTATPSATGTSSATPSPPPSFRAYLPQASRGLLCLPRASGIDVVLVQDLSTSMLRQTRAGRSKLAASRSAARDFLAQLDPARDRAAVVGFNDVAWISAELSARPVDWAAALAAHEDRVMEGTRLDLALEMGQRALEEAVPPARPGPVLLLLTDGLPNRVPIPPGGRQEDTVLAQARRAKAAGTRILAIGLGPPEEVSMSLLSEVASAPAEAYRAPDGEDLAAIYRRIAGRLRGCP